MPIRPGKMRNAPAKKKRQGYEPDTRDLEIYARVCRGAKLKTVAERFDLTPAAIHFIVKKIDTWLAPQLMGQIREIKANHTTRLMHIYTEAMRAWEKSKRAAEEEHEKNSGPNPGTDYKRKFQVGNPAYLQEARAALDQIREIWGANAPLQIEHSGEVRVAGRDVADARSELMDRLQKLTAASQN